MKTNLFRFILIAAAAISCAKKDTGLLEVTDIAKGDFNQAVLAVDSIATRNYMEEQESDVEGDTIVTENLPLAFEAFRERYDTLIIDSVRYYIVEGDLLYDDDELRSYYRRQPSVRQSQQKSNKLVISVYNEKLSRWPANHVIRYAVQRNSFQDDVNFEIIKNNMLRATAEWEATCGVDFEYVPMYDNSRVGSIPAQVDFVVREINGFGEFIAIAFFPHSPRDERKLMVDLSYYHQSDYDPVGVLRHELGHVLGFMHEHIRSGAPRECPGESNQPILLTSYDPQSVMHYFCGEMGSRTLDITDIDRQGSQLVYGPPHNK